MPDAFPRTLTYSTTGARPCGRRGSHTSQSERRISKDQENINHQFLVLRKCNDVSVERSSALPKQVLMIANEKRTNGRFQPSRRRCTNFAIVCITWPLNDVGYLRTSGLSPRQSFLFPYCNKRRIEGSETWNPQAAPRPQWRGVFSGSDDHYDETIVGPVSQQPEPGGLEMAKISSCSWQL